MTEIPSLDRAFQTTRSWLKELAQELQWLNERKVYAALRAVLHALRDRLTLEESAHFGAQLPTFIRGIYYEGWRHGPRRLRNRSKEAFLQEIDQALLTMRTSVDSEYVTQVIFGFLSRKIAAGELSDVRGQLPKAIRTLWPESTRKVA